MGGWCRNRNPDSAKATYSEFLQQVQSGQVGSAIVMASDSNTDHVSYRLKNGSELQTVVPAGYREVLDAMQENKVNIEIRDANSQWLRILLNATPFLLLLGFWVFMMRRMRSDQANRAAK